MVLLELLRFGIELCLFLRLYSFRRKSVDFSSDMVMQEEGDSSNSGCGGDRPKKAKPNKIPQRGLGIAALEKLRREEQQSKIPATHTSGSSSSEHSATGIIFNSLKQQPSPASPFLPVLDPSSNIRPFFIGNYPLIRPALDPGDGSPPLTWNSPQSDLRLRHVPRKQLPMVPELYQHQTYSVSKSMLSPPSSSGANLQIEPPSNQSFVSMNPSPRPDEHRLAGMKRPWPFHPGGTSRPLTIASAPNPTQIPDSELVLVHGGELKRAALSREDASSSTGHQTVCRRNADAEQDGAMALDGNFLSLSSASTPTATDGFQQQYWLPLQPSRIQRNTENAVPEAAEPMQPPSLYNFMGLPDDLIGSKTGDADVNSKMNANTIQRSL